MRPLSELNQLARSLVTANSHGDDFTRAAILDELQNSPGDTSGVIFYLLRLVDLLANAAAETAGSSVDELFGVWFAELENE